MGTELDKRNQRRARRAKSVRGKINGTAAKPRLSVLRTNKHLFAQLIDDESRTTIVGLGTAGKKNSIGKKSKETAKMIGMKIGQAAKEKNISEAVFDRGCYKYHGLVAEIANGAREVGLKI